MSTTNTEISHLTEETYRDMIRKDLDRIARSVGLLKSPLGCDHGTRIFNGQQWRCKDCGVRLKDNQ